jgi:glycerol-3-phosphate acyltransferase PlsX
MKIAIDVMGGDHAPESVLKGILELSSSEKGEIILVGDEKEIKSFLSPRTEEQFEIVHTSEFVQMNEEPTVALKNKSQASILLCNELVKTGRAQAVISAGHTGAAMAASYLRLGKLPGIYRPALASVLPSRQGLVILLDVGANVDCKSRYLFQFAVMGYSYAKYVLGQENPKVGLLNIGSEENKGNHLTLQTYKLLKKSNLNFIGNVEGKDILSGKADVVVCDGFIGNIILKFAEGTAEILISLLKEILTQNVFSKIGTFFLSRGFRDFKKRVDYAEYGGVPLLGINGVSIIAHGHSSPRAIKNAIKVAREFINHQLNQHITEEIRKNAI